jgi:hypothetical protein
MLNDVALKKVNDRLDEMYFGIPWAPRHSAQRHSAKMTLSLNDAQHNNTLIKCHYPECRFA